MTPKFFDAHTHLNMIGSDWLDVGQRALQNDVWFINVGADSRSSEIALGQVETLRASLDFGNMEKAGVWSTAGIHPTETDNKDFGQIERLVNRDEVVAVGECGLEYFRLEGESHKLEQQALFKKHVDLAIGVRKPLMIHCRANSDGDAYWDMLEILGEYKKQAGSGLQFNMHFFTANSELAGEFVKLDAYFSFPGVVTFTEQYDEVVRAIPLNRLMVETDAPFAAPIPHRGERNEPSYVQFTANRIVELRQESREDVLSALVINPSHLFLPDRGKF